MKLGVTLQAIHSGKRFSNPRNPVVSEALFLAGYIEKWGTGLNKMKTLMVERGLNAPQYEVYAENFVVTLLRPSSKELYAEKGVQETTQETTQEKIILLLKDIPSLTRKQLAEQIGITPDGIKYHLDQLRKVGKIQRKGATKKGYWEIVSDSEQRNGSS